MLSTFIVGLVGLHLATTSYVHCRGRVRFNFASQLTDHSTALASLNTLFYLSSNVPAKPYLDPADFPQLAPLTENWEAIREECLSLIAENAIAQANGCRDAGFNSFFKVGWKRFYLTWYGVTQPSALEKCPRTVALLEKIPSVKAAMFALLPPGAKLCIHRDPYAGSLRYHLGLVTPNSDECYLDVDGERRSWRDGQPLMFDETYIHTAHNNTAENRLILFCDVQRPLNNPLARWADAAFRRVFMRAAAAENLPGEKIGWINQLFGPIYSLRGIGRFLKRTNVKLYYALKLSSLAGAVAAAAYGLYTLGW